MKTEPKYVVKESIVRLNSPSNNSAFTDTLAGYYLYGPVPGNLVGFHTSSSRSVPVKSPVVQLGGKPFRYPTSYNRFVRKFEKVEHSWTNRSLSYSVPGSNTTGMILLSNYPPYWTNNSVVLDSNIAAEANNRALNKIKDSKASLGVTIGESVRAASMLASSAESLIRALIAAKKGQWRKVGDILGLQKDTILSGLYPANKWLEYQYGWKPLLSDLHAQYEIIRHGLAADNFLIHGKGGGHRKSVTTDQTYDSVHRIYSARERTGEQICVTRLIAKLSSPKWRQAGQVGLINPLEVAWELIPFSFVIDWFMPIGNALEALTARAGLDFVTGSRTWVTGGYCSLKATGTTGNALYKKHDVRIRVFFHNRERLYTWPIAIVYTAESPFSTTRVLNALALWRVLLGGPVPSNIRNL